MNPALRLMMGRAVAAGGFDPSDISGLAQWQKGGTGADYTYSSSNLISQWADKSGNSRHWTQSTAGRYPTAEAAVLNGQYVTRFNDLDDFLTCTNYASGFTAGELFVVIKKTADPGDGGGFHAGFDNSFAGEHYPFTDGNIYENWGTNTRPSLGNPSPSLASWRLYNVRTSSSNWSVYLDGTSLYSTGTNTVAFGSAAHVVGRNSNTTGVVGDIAEWIVFDNVISSGDRTSLHDYIETEYGLTIA